MQKIVTAPGGFGVMVIEINDRRPSRDELAIRGDDSSSNTNFVVIALLVCCAIVGIAFLGSFFV